jgi:acetoin utilization deacetylase AcuC-like enzyme
VPGAWFRHDAHLAHDVPGHPERPARIRALEEAMERRSWFGLDVREAPEATREALLAVHPESHVASIEALCARGGGMIDMDTSCEPGTFAAALRGAGGACAAVDVALGEGGAAVSGMRPPGHHAETATAMGFCFFNSVAVAARHAQRAHGVERVLILDWDVHHGNGTAEIFHADPSVLFVSIHQSPLYPGTGAASDLGSGDAVGTTVNLPVPPGSGDATFASLVEHVVGPLGRAFEPGLVLVSAGFDAHRLDPLAQCEVTPDGFAAMTASVRALGVPVGVVLEGGYSLDALTESMTALVPVLLDDAPAAPSVARHGLADAALERLAPYWPALSAA